ncbi:18430_t:CDS:2, partial [Racocetra persica]
AKNRIPINIDYIPVFVAIVFGTIQLWKATLLLHPTKCLKTLKIFPQASKEEITKYEKQLTFQNRRRDENSRCIFHFATVTELYTVRNNTRALFPNAFFVPTSLQAQHPNAPLHPVGTAWILTEVGVRNSDFGEDDRFFSYQLRRTQQG